MANYTIKNQIFDFAIDNNKSAKKHSIFLKEKIKEWEKLGRVKKVSSVPLIVNPLSVRSVKIISTYLITYPLIGFLKTEPYCTVFIRFRTGFLLRYRARSLHNNV